MNKPNEHIDYDLIAKYLANEASAEEVSALEKEISNSVDLKKEVDELRLLWDVSAEPELEVNTDAAWNKISPQIIEIAGNESVQRPVWLRVAAAVVITIGVTAAFWFMNNDGMLEMESKNHMSQVSLSDGTVVTLDEGSILSYPEKFESNLREVTIDGVGFFQVTADKDHPFIVHTDVGDVRVVGTAFEVDTRKKEHAIIVTVQEGIVEVSKPETDLFGRVTAGQTCELDDAKNHIEVKEMLSPAAFYWKNKIIKFKSTQLSSVVQTLNDVLEIDVRIESKAIEGCELTATFKDETPEAILEVISATLNLQLTKTNDQYSLSGEGC